VNPPQHAGWATISTGLPVSLLKPLVLPDNYATALPSLWAYGFDYDPNFTSRAGASLQAGIESSEALLTQKA